MVIKKDHKDCWNNHYDQNNQHIEYVVTNIILPYVDYEYNYFCLLNDRKER